MEKQFFITGIGTDIGKSFIASVIACHWLRGGKKVAVCKPIMSGIDDFSRANDAAILLEAINLASTEENIRLISPWIFKAALSPNRAAELAGQHIDFDALIAWCQTWLAQNYNAYALIEGAGGVAVPINYTHHMADLMHHLHLPVILVASDYLGAISHSLTALHFLHNAGVSVEAVIVNQSNATIDHIATCATIAKFSPYVNAPMLSFKRADEQEIDKWRNDLEWHNSNIWQDNLAFFEFFK